MGKMKKRSSVPSEDQCNLMGGLLDSFFRVKHTKDKIMKDPGFSMLSGETQLTTADSLNHVISSLAEMHDKLVLEISKVRPDAVHWQIKSIYNYKDKQSETPHQSDDDLGGVVVEI